ncbi:hypothetical protein TUM17577_40010 [Enterobacter asburiae]|nr:hypothetical protein TUM17577_40010 [Enterobacter asburiae]
MQAVHNPSYRDRLYRLIVEHLSEWYYGKDEAYWKPYLDTLATDPSLAYGRHIPKRLSAK